MFKVGDVVKIKDIEKVNVVDKEHMDMSFQIVNMRSYDSFVLQRLTDKNNCLLCS